MCDLQGTLGRGVLRTALALPTSSGRRRNATDGNSVCIQLTQAPLVVPVVGLQWEVWVACGSLKGGRADWLVEKCVELGAAALVPLLTQRSPTCSGDAGDDGTARKNLGGGKTCEENIHIYAYAMFFHPACFSCTNFISSCMTGSAPHKRARTKSGGGGGGRVQRWQRLAVAAAKQSLRVHGMRIEEPASLEAMLATLHNAPPAVALLATGGAPPILSVLGAAKRPPGDARGVLLVGPEGDFTPEEMEAIVAAGALPVGLGELRLRVETAALSGLSAARAWAFGI